MAKHFFGVTLPFLATLVPATLILLEYYLKIPGLTQVSQELVRWNILMAAFAMGLGLGSTAIVHAGRIRRRSKDSFFSVILLVTIAVFLVVGIGKGSTSAEYQVIWNNILAPLSATTFSTTFFFISSAAFRALRVRGTLTAVFVISAVIVMAKVGVGQVLFPFLTPIGEWLLNIPNTAGMRAVTVGGAIALVANSFRIITGLERGHMGGQ
jgi:cytochrome bd-type quinol oxidase subunit 2